MDSSTTYTVEYRFATPIRLKGDGVQPAMLMNGKRMEFYNFNYTHEVLVKDAGFIVESGGDYKVDTTNGPITATVHPTVKSAWFGDSASTWNNTNKLTVVTDAGDITFGNPEQGKRFQVISTATGWSIYNADGSLHGTTP